MNTPICDFIDKYRSRGALRLHMPGHKGVSFLGFEERDITEFEGADCLYSADGIIAESEKNAGTLFGADTFYSAEGSSLSIKAMLYLTLLYAKGLGKKPVILAARNAHKAFLSGVSLLDIEVRWLYTGGSYLSAKVEVQAIEKAFCEEKPTALYITSPDYLGNISDIAAISKVCKRHGVLLLVDNAHGAYLKFLPKSLHPIDLGADVCTDSAHKTLPALTGAAYLHVSKSAPEVFKTQAKNALALFGSTSPSYLLLESLDMVNKYLAKGYGERLASFIEKVEKRKHVLSRHGYTFIGGEPLKLTLSAKAYGYTGTEFAKILSDKNIMCEFYDPDYTVLMLTPETGDDGLDRLTDVLLSVPERDKISTEMPTIGVAETVMSPREALMSPSERVPVRESVGRVLASVSVSCPPAVPIVICGEVIDDDAVRAFGYYGVTEVSVVK